MANVWASLVAWIFFASVAIGNAAVHDHGSSTKQLDGASLNALNKEVRKAMLRLVVKELKDTKKQMTELEPQLLMCQATTTFTHKDCTKCILDSCSTRFEQCAKLHRDTILQGAPAGLTRRQPVPVPAPGLLAPLPVSINPGSSGASAHRKDTPSGLDFLSSTANRSPVPNKPRPSRRMMPGNTGTSHHNSGSNNHSPLVNMQNLPHSGRSSNPYLALSNINTITSASDAVVDLNFPNPISSVTLVDGIGTVCHWIDSRSSQTCQKIMNPSGMIVRSISTMGNNLKLHLGSAYRDMGGAVIYHVNGLKSVVHSVNGTGARKAEGLLSGLESGLQKLERGIDTMMAGVDHDVNKLTSQIDHGVNNIMTRVDQGIDQMTLDLNTGFTSRLTQSLNNMFGSMFGRSKRSIPCDQLLADPNACHRFRSHCPSCRRMMDTKHGDPMKSLCGENLVSEMEKLDRKLRLLMQLQNMTVASGQIISSVLPGISNIKFDPAAFDPSSLGYNHVVVTANILGFPRRFRASTPLQLADLKATGSGLAREIWEGWTTSPGRIGH